MNVLSATVVLRERSLPDTVDVALRFVVQHARTYAALSAIVLVPGVLLSYGLGALAGWGWGWTAAILAGLFAQAPFTALTARLLFGDRLSAWGAIRQATRHLPGLLAGRTLQLVAVLGGLFVMLLPAAWFGAVLLVLPEVLMLEGTHVAGSMGRTYRLTSSQLGEAMMATLLLFAAFVAAPILVDVVGRSLLEDVLEVKPPPSLFTTGGGFFPMLGLWLYVPFCAVVRFFVYVNLRTRTEGWDIQTVFSALVQRANLAEATP